MDNKISIIIPAYNAEKYIERCLDSILDQDYNISVEIIVVNDGSTDSTAMILKRYESQYPGLIKIITKENGGVSSARNAGLSVATGVWIWFVDSDDYIPRNSISYEIDHFLSDDIDICKFGGTTLDPVTLKTFTEPEKMHGEVLYEGRTIARYAKIIPTFVVTHIYRKSAIDGILFQDVLMGEDTIFNFEVYMRDLRIRETNTNIYRYTVNEGQATGKRNKESSRRIIEDAERFYDKVKRFQNKADNITKDAIDTMIANQFTPFMSRALSADYTRKEFSELMTRLSHKGVFPIREIGKQAKIVNFIGKHPFLYPLESFVFRRIFYPHIVSRMSRN